MKTFIRAVEYWLPAGDRSQLEFGGALYGSARRLAAVSPRMVFGRGEGLPGRAWELGHPLVFRQLEVPSFRRAEAARADGLTCGIAVPMFGGEFLSSVLVIFCGDDEAHAGAIEVWHNDPSASKDMTLADGYYGTTGEAFELTSRRMGFRRGHGLPGMAWDSGLPVFIDDLGHSARFLRADDARRVGINRGFALPCSTPGADHWVLAFLSALATPIVRRFEVWQPDAARERMCRSSGFCETAGALGGAPDGPSVARGQGSVGMTLLTGVPAVGPDVGAEPATGAEARRAGLGSMVAIPLLRDGRLQATVAWYF